MTKAEFLAKLEELRLAKEKDLSNLPPIQRANAEYRCQEVCRYVRTILLSHWEGPREEMLAKTW